jgi:hypothetical protein
MAMSAQLASDHRTRVSLLAIVLTVLVAVHFAIAVAFPLLFVLAPPRMPHRILEVGGDVWNVWRCQPILIAFCLFLARRSPPEYRWFVIIDVAISVLQPASIYFLYSCYEFRLLH